MTQPKSQLARLNEESHDLATLDLDTMLADLAGVGLENVKSDDIILPKLLLLQPTSPLASEDDFKAGNLVDSINLTNYKNQARFYVVHYYPSRTKWEGSEEGTDSITSPVECVSNDAMVGSKFGSCATCPFAQWGSGKKKGQPSGPACTEFKNLILVPAEDPTSIPMMFSAKRTGLKAVKQLLSGFMYQKGPMFMYETVITTVKNSNDDGTWFVPSFKRGTRVPDVATLQALMDVNKRLKEAQDRIKTRDTDENLEGGAATATSDDDADGEIAF